MDDLKMMEMQIESLKRNCRINLERRLDYLIKSLERELDDLRNNPNYLPNSGGIIQGESATIDELCIKLGVLESIKQS